MTAHPPISMALIKARPVYRQNDTLSVVGWVCIGGRGGRHIYVAMRIIIWASTDPVRFRTKKGGMACTVPNRDAKLALATIDTLQIPGDVSDPQSKRNTFALGSSYLFLVVKIK